MSSGGEDQNNNTTLLQGSRLLYITQDGNQSVGINSFLDPSTNAVMGLVIFNELNDPPNQTRISINNEGITETFANGDPSINVSWENFYLLKEATPALRIPDVSTNYVVNNTYEANDNNLAKTRKATLSAVSATDPTLALEILTTGEKATLTQDTLTYLDMSGGTPVSASWASIIAGNPTPSLSGVLAVGNSAGTFDIDMSGNNILNCASITSIGDLLLNPVGSIDANGKTLNMTDGEIHNCPLIHSQNNNDITIEGKGTGDLILKTANTNRISVLDSGVINFQGGMSYNNATDTLTATTFNGNVSTATTATNATNVATTASTATTNYITFVGATSGNNGIRVDADLTYNASTNTLTATTFSGDLNGNATTATSATSATTATTATSATTATNATNVATAIDTTNTSFYPTFVSATTGNNPIKVDSDLTYNPSTNTLTATTFSGALSGNATTATSATTATTATNATNATNATTATNANNTAITASATNATFYPTFVSATTGNLPQLVDGDLTYNPSTNTLTATTFSGALSGNATTATTATNATNVATATDATNASFYPTFVSATSGNNPIKVDGDLTYNPSTNTLTAPTISATTALSGLLQTFSGQTTFKMLFGETGGGTSSGTITYSTLSPTTTFTNTPYVFLTAIRDNNATHCAFVRTISNTAFTWNCRDETGALINANVQFLLIGK